MQDVTEFNLTRTYKMNITTEIIHETALFVKDYFTTEFSAAFSFHNYSRTVNIVRNCDAIGVAMKLKNEELKYLHIAAWFLETGYIKNYEQPQNQSVIIAANYLTQKGIDQEIIKTIEEIILATRIPQQPLTLMAQVICDAGMYHLAEKDIMTNLENLRQEIKTIQQKEYSIKDWLAKMITDISEHFYFTSEAKELFEKKKQKHKAALQKQLDELQDFSDDQTEQTAAVTGTNLNTKPSIEDIKLERGVETFFRITERRHMELSTKAHDKASLLISVNSIVISIVLSVLITKLEDNKFLLLPTLFLVITCATTIVLSIISTRPRILKINSKNKHTTHDEVNILFFADSTKLSLHDYKAEMKKTYENKTLLYDSLSRDIYYQGLVLVWKYKYINIAYNIFMYGFIITILSFIVAFIIHTT